MKTLLTITGKSATGKTTLEADLAHEFGFSKAVSHTTRPPRVGEVEGQAYYFVSAEEFTTRWERGEFVETNTFNGNGYAVSVKELDTLAEKGTPVVLVVDPNGHEQIVEWIEQNPAQGWRHISLYLVIDIPTQCHRFLNRALPDLVTEDPKKLASTVNRMVAMFVDEKDWDERCIQQGDFYVIDYTPETRTNVLKAINQIVNEDYFATT